MKLGTQEYCLFAVNRNDYAKLMKFFHLKMIDFYRMDETNYLSCCPDCGEEDGWIHGHCKNCGFTVNTLARKQKEEKDASMKEEKTWLVYDIDWDNPPDELPKAVEVTEGQLGLLTGNETEKDIREFIEEWLSDVFLWRPVNFTFREKDY